MKTLLVILIIIVTVCCFSFSLRNSTQYKQLYTSSLDEYRNDQEQLLTLIRASDLGRQSDLEKIKEKIAANRIQLKSIDFWLRYFEPNAYRKQNGPLPVEWETEVFEKFEAPYRRTGAGLTLAELYLDEAEPVSKDSLSQLIKTSLDSLVMYKKDSIMMQFASPDHFFLANRLYLLNLAAVYTTGFECPDTSRIIPELRLLLTAVKTIYSTFAEDFPATPLTKNYVDLYDRMIAFANRQPAQFSLFDQFSFIREYINPLFKLNQQFIRDYNAISISYNDFALNNETPSLFDKSLFISQNTKGIFSLVDDPAALSEVKRVGKLLFYDPILSGNNRRSCASCHKPTEFFTDTALSTPLKFEGPGNLSRNSPSLINSVFNHLIMLDGKHISLQGQAQDVMTKHEEMNSNEEELVKKVMTCKEYRDVFKKLLRLTPEEKKVSFTHIISAITFYYADFSYYYSPFDRAMNENAEVTNEVKRGFNLFMSKAQCGTCHFVPHFNGIKPPYIGSEFEVLGVPEDASFSRLSDDKGRYDANPSIETLHAFRTNTVRNIEFTKPYMHNGVFKTLDEVINFYDTGGGAGKKLDVPNQTLASDSLKLDPGEKKALISFMHSLNENIIFEAPPSSLPSSSDKSLNTRKVGGEY